MSIILHILHLEIEINFKLKVKMKNILIYGFQCAVVISIACVY